MHRGCIGLIAFALVNILMQCPTLGASSAKLVPVRVECRFSSCFDRHVVVFVHGIYGSEATFEHASTGFSWPLNVRDDVLGHKVDVYRLDYRTKLISWAKANIAYLDGVVYDTFDALGPLRDKYRSIGFIAHSLGGNVVASYLHTVKTDQGHVARASNVFVISLGTPYSGAQIANVGLLFKEVLGISDPLLTSLAANNTFLRFLERWRQSEDRKAAEFHCRPVHLYAAVETKPMGTIQIVDVDEAVKPIRNLAVEIKKFDRNHAEIAKPKDKSDDLYRWVDGIITNEFKRADDWSGPLCTRPY